MNMIIFIQVEKKHVTKQVDNDRYGSVSFLDFYSTPRQNTNVEPYFKNEYNVNSMPYSEKLSASVKSPDYDYSYQSNKKRLVTIIPTKVMMQIIYRPVSCLLKSM